MFSTIYDKKRAHMHHRHHPFHSIHQGFANYGTETMQKVDLRDFSDDLLHNLHGIPDPLRKNLADTIITSENPIKSKKKLEEPRKMPEKQPEEIPTVQTSALSGILGFISGVFHSVSGAMFRPRSPVYYDCFNDSDWHSSKTEQDKIGTESPADSPEMNTDAKTAVAACEGKLNQVRYLLSSPRPIGSVWVRKRPKKAFVEPGSVEESFEDAFSPEDFVNLPDDSFIEYYSPYSYQNGELFETGALKTKVEEPITETTDIIKQEIQEKDCSNQENQLLKPEIETSDSMNSEDETLNLENNNYNTKQENQEKSNTEISANTEQNIVQQKETFNNENQTTETPNKALVSKDEVDYVATDKHQIISSCEDKLSKLKALLSKNKKNHNENIETMDAESTKPISNSKTTDKHFKNPHRTLDKRKKMKIKKSIQDDILFANEMDPDACIDESVHSPINPITQTCLGDYFDEVTGRFRTSSNNSEDSFQIVFNDTPRVRRSSECDSEDSFIIFEDSPDSCYTSNDVFQDSDSETESDVSDSGCSTLTCKLSHSLSRTVSNLTDDSLYAESGDEIDYATIEKVLKCDEIDDFRDRSVLKSTSDELKERSDDLNHFGDELKLSNNEIEQRSDEIDPRSDELSCEVAKKTGLLLDDDRKKSRRGKPVKKVHFSTQPPKVHLMRVWSFAARQARAGHWERYAVDRERFKRRIADVDMAVSWVLKPQHRARIKFQRFMPWWNQQRRAEIAEKKRKEEEDRVRDEELARAREELIMQEHDDVRKLEEEEERVRLEELSVRNEEEKIKVEEIGRNEVCQKEDDRFSQKEEIDIITQQNGLLRQPEKHEIVQNEDKNRIIQTEDVNEITQEAEKNLITQNDIVRHLEDHRIGQNEYNNGISQNDNNKISKKEERDPITQQGLFRQPEEYIAQKEEHKINQIEGKHQINQEDHRNSKKEEIRKEETTMQKDFSENNVNSNTRLNLNNTNKEKVSKREEIDKNSVKEEILCKNSSFNSINSDFQTQE